MGDQEDMPRVKVYGVGSVPVVVMELEFVYGEHPCRLLQTDQFRAIDGVEILQALRVYVVLTKPGKLCHLLERVGPKRLKVTGILPKLHEYLVPIRFERHHLHMGVPRAADKLYPVKTYHGKAFAEAQMT